MVTLAKDSNCLRCGKNSLLTDNDTGERFCGKCGYVVSEKLNESGPEWRSFQTESGSNPARTGAPLSLLIHDMGLSTVINPINKDATGKPLSTSMKSTIERLRTWDSRSKVNASADRNLRQALTGLAMLKDKLSLSTNVLEKASSCNHCKHIPQWDSCNHNYKYRYNHSLVEPSCFFSDSLNASTSFVVLVLQEPNFSFSIIFLNILYLVSLRYILA